MMPVNLAQRLTDIPLNTYVLFRIACQLAKADSCSALVCV